MEVKSAPRISVLMSVYNGANMVGDAIESILTQTFQDFEFIIIDDGSTDESLKIIEGFATLDSRLVCITNEQNLGLIASLNKGIGLAKGQYLARIDADDIALPKRLESQLVYLELNPQLIMCGSAFRTLTNSTEKTSYYAERHEDIKFNFLTDCHICHGAVLWDNKRFKDAGFTFDPNFKHAEDYDLFARIIAHHQVGNLQEVTMKIRKHNSNVSHVFNSVQQANSYRIRQRMFDKIGVSVDEALLDIFSSLHYQAYQKIKTEGSTLKVLLESIMEGNRKSLYFDPSFLTEKLSNHWFHYCYNTKQKKLFYSSRLAKQAKIIDKLKMTIKG